MNVERARKPRRRRRRARNRAWSNSVAEFRRLTSALGAASRRDTTAR